MRLEAALDRHESAGDDIALSRVEFKSLIVLAAQGPCRPSALAEALDLSRSRVTRLCDRLEERDWIKRSADPRDRRAVRVELSAKGRQTLSTIEEAGVKRVRRLLEPIAAGQRKALLDVVQVVVEAQEQGE